MNSWPAFCGILLLLLAAYGAAEVADEREVVVESDVPRGWLVADLFHLGRVPRREWLLRLEAGVVEAAFFDVNQRSQVVVKRELKTIEGRTVTITLVTSDSHAILLRIHVRKSKAHFTHRIYTADLPQSSSPDVLRLYNRDASATDRDASLTLAPPDNDIAVQFVFASYHSLPLRITTVRGGDGSYHGKLRLTGSPELADLAVPVYISAYSSSTGLLMASCRLEFHGPDQSNLLEFHGPAESEPFRFSAGHYAVELDARDVHEGEPILRVQTLSSLPPVSYQLQPDSDGLLEIAPLSGEVFAVVPKLQVGIHDYHVIGRDAADRSATATLRVVVSGASRDASRARRRSGEPEKPSVTVVVLENNREPVFFHDSLPLERDERALPASAGPLSALANGTIRVAAGLDYEQAHEYRLAVTSRGGGKRERHRLVRLVVEDEDEPPAFVNEPRPLLAVVSPRSPLGFHVYKLDARDEMGVGDGNVRYHLINSEPDGYFTVDERTGVVRTARADYAPGGTFRLFVEAVDTLAPPLKNTTKTSEVAVLEVLAADRPPQFLRPHYHVELREDASVEASVVDARAQSFRPIDETRTKGAISYSLRAVGDDGYNSWFHIDTTNGIVHVSRPLDYDNPTNAKRHQLIVTAAEDGKQSTAELTVDILDVNDNPPLFTQPLYSAHVREDIPVGETIMKVLAKDKDSGRNARIHYSLSDGNFSINDAGEIAAATRLDADQLKERFFVYKFNVTASDDGVPPLSAMAQVHIRTENTNDEAPVFLPTAEYTAYVAEDAQGGTPVLQVQARDADRDQVLYFFSDDSGRDLSEVQHFQIDKDTGVIRLKPGVSPEALLNSDAPYNLSIVARDDGSCCVAESGGAGGGGELHSSYAVVRIGIEDVNNNKPEFKECAEYSTRARLKEGSYKAERPVIIKVVATDEDSSSNGQIVYSLYHSQSESRKAFTIDPLTGELYPSPHVLFDRETRAREEVTVKATDRGDRPLIGFCQFSIEIEDVNDNAPVFDRESYQTSISRHEAVGSSILSVSAVDADAAPNARVSYAVAPDVTAGDEHANDASYVAMLAEESGEILLARPLPPNGKKDDLRFLVTASDNGKPIAQQTTALVTVLLHERHQKAPVWKSSAGCPNVVRIKENAEMNKMILRCLAQPSHGASVMYKLVATAPGQSDARADAKFRQFNFNEHAGEAVKVFVMESLDYETSPNYTLTLTATDMSSFVSSSRTFSLLVEDENDSVPQFTVDLFTGTLDEELTPVEYEEKFGNKPIAMVQAEDADSPGPQSEVHYSILPKADDAHKHFRIDARTGAIYPLAKLDREEKDEYILTVQARDNAPSSLPGVGPQYNTDTTKVRIVIADVNDNAPYFNESRYEGRVAEDAEIGHAIITVKAHDRDRHSKLRYDLSDLNGKRMLFGVRTDSGTIFVKEPLDFERDQSLDLVLLVSDGKHNATTRIRINIDDVNDNAPRFEQAAYAITLEEEDPDFPKTIFRVRASDEDSPQTNGEIRYRLEGQGAGDLFRIDEISGDIEVVSSLDRDPPRGVPTWKLIAHAVDKNGAGLVGYADVQVNLRDINDNAPVFPSEMFGYLDENRPVDSAEGVFVLIVSATDFDDPASENARLEYSIVSNKLIDGQPIFRIEEHSGKIFAMRSLDRESPGERELRIRVRATDGGRPPREGTGNVTIRVRDKNDNAPFFEKPEYEARVSEAAPLHSAILSVSAIDADDEDPDNKLTYSLVPEGEWWDDFFYMTTEADSSASSVGVLRLKQV